MDKQRTNKQSRALHLWCKMLAEELNEAGLTIEKTLTGKAEILWHKDTVKQILFKQIMKKYTLKTSTTQLTTKELIDTAEQLTKYLAEQHGLLVEFPSIQTMLDNERLK